MSSFRKAITYIRTTGGDYDQYGMWQDGISTEGTIQASVQPLNGDERAQYSTLAPEGATEYKAVKIYSDDPLYPAKQAVDGAVLEEADRIIWRGHQYKIVMLEEWQSDVINHFRMIAWELDALEPDEDSDGEGGDEP